ncbi:MAG: hypothetical protein E7474_01415 [Ruminococcaceae bacterium]|nr:hypothetical protein [Oscillospiraceae bacterium]
MKRIAPFAALLLAVSLLCGCVGGADTAPPEPAPAPVSHTEKPLIPAELTYAEGTVLRMATGYNSPQTGMSFDADTAGDGVTLADGVTYRTGDLKPTWAEAEKRLNITIEDKYQGNSAGKELAFWSECMDEIDLVSGSADSLTEAGEAGKLLDISRYLDVMPNLRAFLESDPVVLLSITGNTDIGAFYFAPYFDGVDDIERMPLMRVDWVEKLLDGGGAFTAPACNTLGTPYYLPYMPTSGQIMVDVVKPDGTGIEIITKDYDAAGNIIQKMNAAGEISGVSAVNMLRGYIDRAYGGYYGTKRSDLFVGQNAAWDADELVALLRCVVANPQTLNGTDSVQGLFTRADENNNRRADLVRFAGQLFGVRGLESRQDYLYFDLVGKLHDARQEADTYRALDRMHAMAQEGLISASFLNGTWMSSEHMLANDMGFMHYDYNQTQTVYNRTVLQAGEGERYMAVMLPVACWQDGSLGSKYMRFTESWRSVKPTGWGISRAGVANDPDKLCAALRLIDYAYSDEGTILMSYGPDAFIKTNGDGSYATFAFNGAQMPEIAEATYAELWEKSGGSYTDYARRYLGSTLGFVKSQAYEYQCLSEVGKEGADHISAAIALGTIKHPELQIERVSRNMWYTSVPTVFPITRRETDLLSIHGELETSFSLSMGGQNLLVDAIVNGVGVAGTNAAERFAAEVRDNMGGKEYLEVKQNAWNRLLACYSLR